MKPNEKSVELRKPISPHADSQDLAQYQCGPLDVGDTDSYDCHVVFDHAVSLEKASHRERFEAVARALRDLLTQRWLLTEQTYERANAKRVYYLSMEFLIGRTLIHNIINLGVEQFVRDDLRSDPRQDWTEVIDSEPDAGLGNGGLGRLAACFHGFNGHASDTRDGLRPALRLRHLSPGNRKLPSGRVSGPLAEASRSMGGGAPEGNGAGPHSLRLPPWARKAIINVGCSGKFSSDRTIAEYAADIWKAIPVRVK